MTQRELATHTVIEGRWIMQKTLQGSHRNHTRVWTLQNQYWICNGQTWVWRIWFTSSHCKHKL